VRKHKPQSKMKRFTIARSVTSAPILCPVPQVQDFNQFIRRTVNNNVRRNDEFASPMHFAGSAKSRKIRKLFDSVDNNRRNLSGNCGMVLQDVFNGGFKLVGRFSSPANHSHE